MRGCIACVLLFLLCPGGVAQQPAPNLRPALEQIDALAAAAVVAPHPGGLTIGVVSGASLVWTRSYGFADRELKIPAGKDTLYRIGSITKPVTGLMFTQLEEQRKVRLSDPVSRYLPEISRISGPYAGAPVTLLQLATHTSGLAREPADLATFLKGPVSDWEKTMLAALARTSFESEPGTRYAYSNIGYAILGVALERAAARPYTDYVRDSILKPLAMADTVFEPNARLRPRLAKGYAITGAVIDTETPAREHAGRGYKVPNGGLYSTVEDLARFAAFLLRPESLSARLRQVVIANDNLTTGYGIGFQIIRRGEMTAVGHGGTVSGYEAAVYVDRQAQTAVIVLSNASGARTRPSSLCLTALQKLAPH